MSSGRTFNMVLKYISRFSVLLIVANIVVFPAIQILPIGFVSGN